MPQANGSSPKRDLYRDFGFFIEDNCYCTYGKNDEVRRLSNFILEPLYDIPDEGTTTRIYKAINRQGQEVLLTLEPEELANLQKFKVKMLSNGSFTWLGKIDNLAMVQEYIFEGSITSKRIHALGWQPEGFFAFGDGIYTDHFIPVDDMGMIKLSGKGLFYLPAHSVMFKKNKGKYLFEKQFSFLHGADVTLAELLKLFVQVYNANGMVAISYVFATLFRDLIYEKFEKFPVLNVFGKPQTGKTHFAMVLKGFFSGATKICSFQQDTYASLSTALAQAANILVIIDEYKNLPDSKKMELGKSLWDGVGRGKMKDGEVERLEILCGVVLLGQEMPLWDPALFTRVIHLTMDTVSHDRESTLAFERLMGYMQDGVCHLTMQILQYRDIFVDNFMDMYDATRREVKTRLAARGEEISDRMYFNWVILLATFRTLENLLPMPFTYSELLNVCLDKIVYQNSICQDTDEVAAFWNVMQVQYQSNRTFPEGDFKILRGVKSLKLSGHKDDIHFPEPKDILIIRHRRALQAYTQEMSKGTKQLFLGERDMEAYPNAMIPSSAKSNANSTKWIFAVSWLKNSKPTPKARLQVHANFTTLTMPLLSITVDCKISTASSSTPIHHR